MSTFTPISTAEYELVSDVLTHYPLPTPVRNIQRIGSGHIHRTYQVDTASGRWVLQALNGQIFPQMSLVCSNVERVISHLHAQHGNPLFLQPTFAGVRHPYLLGAHWRMMPYIEGRVLEFIQTEHEAEAIGYAFGALVYQLQVLPLNAFTAPLPQFHNLSLRYAQMHQAITVATSERLRLAQASLERIAFYRGKQTGLSDISIFPQRLAHHDAKSTNVILHPRQDVPLTVIDFDTVMPGTVLYDLGDLIRSGSHNTPEDSQAIGQIQAQPAKILALVRGFQRAYPLSPLERAHILDAGEHLTLITAVRFLTDFLRGDVYYATRYPHHNFDRCQAQLALLDSLTQQREHLQQILDALWL